MRHPVVMKAHKTEGEGRRSQLSFILHLSLHRLQESL